MNRILIPLLLCAAIAPIEAQTSPRLSSQAACAPKTRRHTVLQCYDLLPSKFFIVKRRELLSKDYPIAEVDTAHDFLQTGGEAAQPSLQVAIFRYGGTELVGVSGRYEMGGTLNFYRFKNGKLRDVTSQVLPVAFKSTHIAELPRIGTTIRVTEENPDTADQKHAYNLLWRGGRFVRR